MLYHSILLLVAGSLCLAAPTKTEQPPASLGAFNVLSLRVGGLPPIIDPSGPSDSDKQKNAMYIGMVMSRFNYGIVNVQMDFSYHKTLYQFDNHPFRTPSSGDAPSGSGLNTLSQFNWIDFSSVSWDVCSHESEDNIDCIINKGFTFMRVRVEEGVYIDMINLDTNTGTGVGDQTARRLDIQKVADFITAHSAGNAVIVFGNTNSLYTSIGDEIRLFAAQNGLKDAWVQAIGGEAPALGADAIVCPQGVPTNISCEVVDKVLYRGSRVINLESSGFFYDTSRFLAPEQTPLTDYNPVRVEFEYTMAHGLRQSDLFGGPHGTWFNDLTSIPSCPKLSSIILRGAEHLDGLTLTLTSGETFTHGGTGGKSNWLILDSEEHITSVRLCVGKKGGHTRNFYAKATTNTGRTIEAGKATTNCTIMEAPSRYGVVGSYGQDGDEMDQLGFIYALQ